MRKIILPLLASALLLSACHHSFSSYVNPFIGTDGHGHTFPGAILPFGMVQVGPDTRLEGWDGCSGYHYSDDTIFGFSHTHLSGTGCSDYGDLLIMPFTAENGVIPDSLGYDFYKSSFSHRNEKAQPGYYRVLLDRNRVMAELTVHDRNALHKYTFPHSGKKGIVIDLKHRDVVINSGIEYANLLLNGKEHEAIIGSRISAAWNPEQHFYFTVLADCSIQKILFYENGKQCGEGTCGISGGDCKAIVFFPDNVKEVTLTVAISAVDIDGSIANIEKSADQTFHQARKAASASWEKALGQFEVEGGTTEDKTNFYTALYHCFTSPYLFSDADGRYLAMKAKDSLAYTIDSVSDGRQQYTVFSVWDTYRALHPLLNITDPKRSKDFVLTMLDHYRHSGELTMWELAGHETHCMIGYHAASVILDAYRTGVLDELDQKTLNDLLQAMVATSNLPMLGRPEYARDGFLSSDYENESVSKTLEYAYDDWCIALMAKHLEALAQKNHIDPQIPKSDNPSIDACANYYGSTYDEYLRRSQSWKNLMDKDGFMHPRRNGAFLTPFDPTEVNNHFTEANSWQYSTYVPHNVNQWINAIGGDQKAETFLDSLFYGDSKMTGREQSDITGVIGQYAHGNEPSHHAAYLYAYLGRQWKTAQLVHRICTQLYHNSPDGLCGNEDCGQMSAWYVFSAIGFYPLCPGSGQYIVGSPLFKKVTIHLQNGKDIVVNTKGNGCYIHGLKINGTAYNNSFISFEQIKDGCVLDFQMGSSPDMNWASPDENRPHSFDSETISNQQESRITPAPLFNDWQQSFDGETMVAIGLSESDFGNASDSIFFTLDGSTPTTSSALYTAPFLVGNDCVVKAIAYNKTSGPSPVVVRRLTRTQKDRTLTYITKPDPQYYENGEAGLIDRLHGTVNYRIGGWQGWQGDCQVIVDLMSPRTVWKVSAECLEQMRSWIFFPSRMEVEVSDDGSQWRPFGSIDNNAFPATLERQELATMHSFDVTSNATLCRYVRIHIHNFGKLPKWHISAGEQAWLFIDEITVE